MSELVICPKCGGIIDRRSDSCLTCGYRIKTSESPKIRPMRSFFLARVLLIGAGLGGFVALGLTWALYGFITHNGYDIIAGSLTLVRSSLIEGDTFSIALGQHVRLLLFAFVGLNVFAIIEGFLPLKNSPLMLRAVLFVLYLAVDVFFLLTTTYTTTMFAPGMLFLDGKGYHLTVISVIAGSVGSLLNLVSIQSTYYRT